MHFFEGEGEKIDTKFKFWKYKKVTNFLPHADFFVSERSGNPSFAADQLQSRHPVLLAFFLRVAKLPTDDLTNIRGNEKYIEKRGFEVSTFVTVRTPQNYFTLDDKGAWKKRFFICVAYVSFRQKGKKMPCLSLIGGGIRLEDEEVQRVRGKLMGGK